MMQCGFKRSYRGVEVIKKDMRSNNIKEEQSSEMQRVPKNSPLVFETVLLIYNISHNSLSITSDTSCSKTLGTEHEA